MIGDDGGWRIEKLLCSLREALSRQKEQCHHQLFLIRERIF